jgi:SAM-dependent methyltransferase
VTAAASPRANGSRPAAGDTGVRALVRDAARAFADAIARRPRRPAGGPVLAGFRCALCRGEHAHELFAGPIPESRGFGVVRCDRCALVATHPLPAADAIQAFYDPLYYGRENAKFGPLTEVFILLFRLARLRALRLAGVRRGTILDVGCGRGLFLRLARRAGYDVLGTELNETSARPARRSVGDDRVHAGPLETAGFATGRFDAVIAWHVFEHLPDPAGTLAECRRIVRPGGVLILAVPNIESWQARWAGAGWFHLDVPRHLFHYGPGTLSAMLVRHGFRPEWLSHYSIEQNPFGLLQSVLHRLGRTHLGLYGLLRGPLDPDEPRHRLRRVSGYLAYLAVFPAAALVSTLASLLRTGATFCVIARRTDAPGDVRPT